MFKTINLLSLDDFFLNKQCRKGDFVFFLRFNGVSDDITDFLKRYYNSARQNGVIIDGKIPNPTPENLSYFSEMLGSDFKYDMAFLNEKLKKWLPRMSASGRESLCRAIFSTFEDMTANGKTESIIKNAYTKYMCWLYYKFERIVSALGSDNIPKILYFGDISHYELQLLVALSRTGADVVLLNKLGESEYLKLDAKSELSTLYKSELSPFPADFSLKSIAKLISNEQNMQRLFGDMPQIKPCTNAWLDKPELSEILKTKSLRGHDSGLFYNAFIVQYGVEEPLLFSNDIFNLYNSIKDRGCLVLNNQIPSPYTDEINEVKRTNYQTPEQLASHLVLNISCPQNKQLESIIKKAFVDTILSIQKQNTLQKLTSKAVYIICLIKRYQKKLFEKWSFGSELPVFILFNPSPSANEELFLNFLSLLPVDVVVIMPDINKSFPINGENLLEIRFTNSVSINQFPSEPSQMRVSTAAYQAEREIDTMLYQDSGIYRNHQYGKADIITLQTTYEETELLWGQELKYRTGFNTSSDCVCVPVIFSKVCGVKNSQTSDYWLNIKKLITEDTIVVKDLPYAPAFSPIKQYATQFLHNGKLQKGKIKSHKDYPYAMLREDMQEHILDKTELLINEKIIKGTYENGTEYSIIATALNLDKQIIRLIQKFDFTKTNPKIIFIITGEKIFSLEDTITASLLHFIGFDVLFFVPTGYRCIEQYFAKQIINEYQTGDYIYDLSVPNFKEVNHQGGFLSKLFGGNKTWL